MGGPCAAADSCSLETEDLQNGLRGGSSFALLGAMRIASLGLYLNAFYGWCPYHLVGIAVLEPVFLSVTCVAILDRRTQRAIRCAWILLSISIWWLIAFRLRFALTDLWQ